ncbi:hypothetical protein V8E51_004058 [Hyaloscypha variabilis]
MASRSKRSESSKSETSWSEWVWDAAAANWYRSRYNARGSAEYEYSPGDTLKGKSEDARYSPTEQIPQPGIETSYSEHTNYDESWQESSSSQGYQERPQLSPWDQYGTTQQGAQNPNYQPAQESYSTSGYGDAVSSMTQAMATTSLSSYPIYPSHYGSSDYQSEKGKGVDTSSDVYAGSSMPGQTSDYSSAYSVPRVETNTPIEISNRSREAPHRKWKSDSRFKVHRAKDFVSGRIFNVIWTNPNMDGPKHLQFLIMRNDRRSSLCLQISSYGGRATTQPGIDPADHTVIYSSRKKGPVYHEGERIVNKPIRIELLDKSHDIDPASRLNYAQLYNVEYDVKVQFIGEVARNHFQTVVTAFNERHPPRTASSGYNDLDKRYFIPETDDERPVQKPIEPRPETPPGTGDAPYYPPPTAPRPAPPRGQSPSPSLYGAED